MKALFARSKAPGRSNQDRSRQTAYEPYRNQSADDAEPLTADQPLPLPPNSKVISSKWSWTNVIGLTRRSISVVFALMIIGMTVNVIVTLHNTKNSRILWPHGMMMKAWPSNSRLAAPQYFLLGAASMITFVNVIMIILLLRSASRLRRRAGQRIDNESQRSKPFALVRNSVFVIALSSVTTAALIAALVFAEVYQPNLKSWSCDNRQYEQAYEGNAIGFDTVCTQTAAPLLTGIFLAAFELWNIADVAITIASQRRRARRDAGFQTYSKNYQRLDDRKSVKFDEAQHSKEDINAYADQENEAYQRYDTAAPSQDTIPMLEMGRGSMK